MEALDVLAQLIADLLGLRRAGDAYVVFAVVVIGVVALVATGRKPKPLPPPPPPDADRLALRQLEGLIIAKKAEVGQLELKAKALKKSIEEPPADEPG